MSNKCCECGCKLTAKNTTWDGYKADRYGYRGQLCDRCAWLKEKYDVERMNGEHDGD